MVGLTPCCCRRAPIQYPSCTCHRVYFIDRLPTSIAALRRRRDQFLPRPKLDPTDLDTRLVSLLADSPRQERIRSSRRRSALQHHHGVDVQGPPTSADLQRSRNTADHVDRQGRRPGPLRHNRSRKRQRWRRRRG